MPRGHLAVLTSAWTPAAFQTKSRSNKASNFYDLWTVWSSQDAACRYTNCICRCRLRGTQPWSKGWGDGEVKVFPIYAKKTPNLYAIDKSGDKQHWMGHWTFYSGQQSQPPVFSSAMPQALPVDLGLFWHATSYRVPQDMIIKTKDTSWLVPSVQRIWFLTVWRFFRWSLQTPGGLSGVFYRGSHSLDALPLGSDGWLSATESDGWVCEHFSLAVWQKVRTC